MEMNTVEVRRPHYEYEKSDNSKSLTEQRNIDEKRNRANECVKMILEAYAVKAKRVVFCGDGIETQNMILLLDMCKRLKLDVTVRANVKILSNLPFIERVSQKLDIKWEVFVWGDNTENEDIIKG